MIPHLFEPCIKSLYDLWVSHVHANNVTAWAYARSPCATLDAHCHPRDTPASTTRNQLFAVLAAPLEGAAELPPELPAEPAPELDPELEEPDESDAPDELAAGAALSPDFAPSPAFAPSPPFASLLPLAAGFADE